jgi:hypothetical protein
LILFYFMLAAFQAGFDRRSVLLALLLVSGAVVMFAGLETTWLFQLVPPGGFLPGAAAFPYRLMSLLGHANPYMALCQLICAAGGGWLFQIHQPAAEDWGGHLAGFLSPGAAVLIFARRLAGVCGLDWPCWLANGWWMPVISGVCGRWSGAGQSYPLRAASPFYWQPAWPFTASI